MDGLLIGWIVAGLVGAAVVSSYKSKKKNTTSSSDSSSSYGNYYICTNSSCSTNNSSIYDDKVAFMDAYHALDSYLADCVGDSYKGVVYLRSGLIGYGKRTGNQWCFDWARTLKDCNQWRNDLSHNKDKWRRMPDPPSYLTDFLVRTLSWATSHYGFACDLVDDGKWFLNNHR